MVFTLTVCKQKTVLMLKEHEGIKLMPQSANSLNIISSDYYLFRSMNPFLHLQHFSYQEEMETLVKEFFTSKDKNWYYHAIK